MNPNIHEASCTLRAEYRLVGQFGWCALQSADALSRLSSEDLELYEPGLVRMPTRCRQGAGVSSSFALRCCGSLVLRQLSNHYQKWRNEFWPHG